MTYPLENALNEFETYTYNVSLWMVKPSQAQDLDQNINTGFAKLIADNSSEAIYNVSEVEQSHIVGFKSGNRHGFSSFFDITIRETNSITLLDTIVKTASELGIENHQLAVYLINIEFNGRLHNGAPKKSTLNFWYPVIINAFRMQVDSGGAQYQIQATETGAAAFNYLENVSKETITFDASTVGETVTEFVRALNLAQDARRRNNRSALEVEYEYEIEFDEESGSTDWLNWNIQQTVDLDEAIGISTSTADGKIQFVLQSGTNITDFIGAVLMTTDEYKRIPLDDGSEARTNGADRHSTATVDKFKTFFKVAANVEFGRYDSVRNDYVKRVRYKVVKFLTPSSVSDVQEYRNSITNTSVQNNRVDKLISQGLLKKRYDYFYTGLNTEVLNLDLTFNFAYFEIVPVQIIDPNTAASQPHNDQLTLDERVITAKREAIDTRTERDNLERELDALRTRRATQTNAVNAFGAERQVLASLNAQVTAAEENLNNLNRTLSAAEQRFAVLEELREQSVAAESQVSTAAGPVTNPIGIDVPLRFGSDTIDSSDTYVPENDRSGGTLMFGGVKANLENGSDLSNIEIEIRGDPYWLGKPNTFYTTTTTGELADYQTGENMFYLKINLPAAAPGDLNSVAPNDSYTISGLYTVTHVINSFRNGLFTQYLKAFRDISTNSSTVSDTLNTDTPIVPLSGPDDGTRGPAADPAQTQEDIEPSDGVQ